MVINERAGSGGDLLPYMFRNMDLGPLIGTRTWGGLVGIWDTPAFVDGGRMQAPRGGFFDVHGEWAVEAEGVGPDIHVEQLPAEVISGHGPATGAGSGGSPEAARDRRCGTAIRARSACSATGGLHPGKPAVGKIDRHAAFKLAGLLLLNISFIFAAYSDPITTLKQSVAL
jgi:hypothetical protein